MLKTILLPLDGSPLAERALPYAATLAQRSNSRVVLVEAVTAQAHRGTNLSDSRLEVTKRANENLRAAANRLVADGVAAEPHTYYDDPVRAILDAAYRHCADLIVMSTHGRSGIGRMLYGSVTDQVLRRAKMPVLVVPSIVEHPWSDDRPLSVLIALDGSELAEEALESADLLTAAGETRLTLLRVIEPPTYPVYGDGYAYVPFDEDAEVANARQYLEGQVARLRERGRQVSGKVILGQPAGAIAATAREQQVDVIVMATHGHGGLSRLLLGSVATSTLRQTTVPLLLTRPAAMHHAEQEQVPPAVVSSIGTASPVTPDGEERVISTLDVRLSALDLELIEHGLKALAHAPGYDYGHVLAAQALAKRLEEIAQAEAGELSAIR